MIQLVHFFTNFRKYLDVTKVYDMEFVFDYEKYSTLMEIIGVVVETVKDYEKQKRYPLNVALEMRFMTRR